MNILIHDGDCILADFGLVSKRLETNTYIEDVQEQTKGTPAYQAPELFGVDKQDKKIADNFSFGQILLELFCSKNFFLIGFYLKGPKRDQAVKKIEDGL